MKIIELRACNVKKLSAVAIKPDGNVVVIGGNNAQGKSSVLDSIMYALGGKDALPPKPVREGATEATISVDLGEFTATRTITPDGKSTLKLTGKDGGRYSSPQSILDGLCGKLSFDPIEFSRQDPKKQLETLKALVGLDFSALDRRKTAKVEERVAIGREVKQLQGQLAGMQQHEGVPTEEVSVTELARELEAARQANANNRVTRESLARAVENEAKWKARIKEPEEELEDARLQHKGCMEYVAKLTPQADALQDVSESAIVARMSSAQSVNRKVRDQAALAFYELARRTF